MRTGLGHLELGSGATYDGTFSKGLPNGVGVRREGGQAQVMRFPDSSRYEGEFLQGWFHGHGLFTTIDGMKYEGGENISLQALAKFGDVIFDILHPRIPRLFPGKIGSFRINKQLPNFCFLSTENQKAWAHIMPCDAYSFLRDLENPVRRCSLI